MDFVIIAKLALVAAVVLILAYFFLNATLSFIARFATQIRKLSKNLLIAVGVSYVLGLVFAPEWVLDLSWPIILLVEKIVPDFLTS